MTVLHLDVYDVDNGGTKHRLTQATSRTFLDDLDGFGSASFAVDAEAAADWAALEHGKVVRFNVDGVDRFAAVIRDMPKALVSSPSTPSGWSRVVRCDGLKSWLGYSRGGGLQYPAKGMDGLQANPRIWGPRGFDFPDPGWPEPTGQPITRHGWPDSKDDPRDQALVVSGESLIRRELTATPDRAGDGRMWLTVAAAVYAEVFLDGERIFKSEVGDRSVIPRNHNYDGKDHVITLETSGDGTIAWKWVNVTIETWIDDEGEEQERERFQTLFRTYNSTTFSGPVAPTEPHWQALINYSDYPGVTPGYIVGKVVDENHALTGPGGVPAPLIPNVDYDFTAAKDSGGIDWPTTIAHGLRLGELGRMVDELKGIVDLDVHITPTSTLQMWTARGQDRTATVTLAEPFAQTESGQGPTLTRALYETEGGLGEVFDDTGAEDQHGPMGAFVQFGTGLGPEQIRKAAEKLVRAEARPSDDTAVEVPDSVDPYVDCDLGDTVTVVGPEGSRPTRLTAFTLTDDPRSGHPEWEARGEG